MKATELRLGNYFIGIYDNKSKIETVRSILAVNEETKDFIGVWDSPMQYYSCDVYPIPLTAEWLVKFGFKDLEKEDREKYPLFFFNKVINQKLWVLKSDTPESVFRIYENINDDYIDIAGVKDGKFTLWTDQIEKLNVIYVHQLQNLYHALTGKDYEYLYSLRFWRLCRLLWPDKRISQTGRYNHVS